MCVNERHDVIAVEVALNLNTTNQSKTLMVLMLEEKG